MIESKVGETKLREMRELAAAARPKESSGHLAWKIVAVAVAGLAVAGLITSLNDIRRYVRMVRM